MNNKITAQRFKNFINYELGKMILVLIAVVIALALALRITAPVATYAQKFALMVDVDVIVNDEGRTLLEDVDRKEVTNFGFSYDILATKTTYLSSGKEHSAGFLMNTYKQAYLDDVFICADAIEDSLYNAYVTNFYGAELVSYVNEALTFANAFYNQDGQLNKDKVIEYFAKVRGKDARFRKDSEYFKGVELECLRINAIKENATKLKHVFDNYNIFYDYEQLKSLDEVVEEGYYAIDFSKLNNYKRNDKSIANAFSRIKDLGDGKYETTLENVVLLVGNNKVASNDLHYEALAVINTLLQTYTTLLD